MANCSICSQAVETHKYVRAKALVKVDESQGRDVFKSAPYSEGHFFFCIDHSLDAIEQGIVDQLVVNGSPIRVLWNPGKHEFRLPARRLRVLEELRARFGEEPSRSLVDAVIQSRDQDAGIQIRKQFSNSADGLRYFNVRDRFSLRVGLRALLGAEVPNG